MVLSDVAHECLSGERLFSVPADARVLSYEDIKQPMEAEKLEATVRRASAEAFERLLGPLLVEASLGGGTMSDEQKPVYGKSQMDRDDGMLAVFRETQRWWLDRYLIAMSMHERVLAELDQERGMVAELRASVRREHERAEKFRADGIFTLEAALARQHEIQRAIEDVKDALGAPRVPRGSRAVLEALVDRLDEVARKPVVPPRPRSKDEIVNAEGCTQVQQGKRAGE